MNNDMNKDINNDNEIPAFDLFAPPTQDNLQEELAKGQYEWTNKYTKVLVGAVMVISLLSVGAWYGHHSATTSAASTSGASLRSALGASGFAGFAAGGGAGTGRAGGGGGGAAGGFGGTRITGTIANVSGNKVTITLDDPTQASSLKSGDSARVTDTAGFGAPAAGIPGAPGTTSTSKSSATKSGTTKPSAGGSGAGAGQGGSGGSGGPAGQGGNGAAGGRGFFSDPAVQACLTKEGVTISAGVRPDRTDPKVAAAFAKCLPGFGSGGGFGGARPSGAPTAAPSN